MNLWIKFLDGVMSRLKYRDINDETGTLYMRRGRFWGWIPSHGNRDHWSHLYLHRIYRPDSDRLIHNHPWRFSVSFILSGGYIEERLREVERIDVNTGEKYPDYWIEKRHVRPFTFNVFTQKSAHRITHLNGPVYTLFFAGPKVQSWGFFELIYGLRRNVLTFQTWRDRFIERGISIELINQEKQGEKE